LFLLTGRFRHYQGHQQNRLTKIVFHFMARCRPLF
jgi:hypothetical protein